MSPAENCTDYCVILWWRHLLYILQKLTSKLVLLFAYVVKALQYNTTSRVSLMLSL